MSKRLIWIALIVFGGTIGCSHVPNPTPPNPPPSAPPSDMPPQMCRTIEVAEPIIAEEGCLSWRRVGLKSDPDGDCPNPGPLEKGEEWTVTHLFEVDSDHELDSSRYAKDLLPALRPFCLYEYKEEPYEALEYLNDKLDRLIGKSLEKIDYGCAAVGPAGSGGGPDPGMSLELKALRDYFLKQIGKVDGFTGVLDERPKVRLVFLDTEPKVRGTDSDEDFQVKSDHGVALEDLAKHMVCEGPDGGGPCAADLSRHLALPIKEFALNDPGGTVIHPLGGGYSGSVDFLATAVWEALKDHPPHQHMVLNMSLAWAGDLFGGLEERVSEMPVTVQALHRALEVASCRGALIVAAAGNRSGAAGANNVGSLLPGAWEERDAPDEVSCSWLLGRETSGGGHSPDCEGSREPLLYAAGGVRFDSSPLHNSRTEGDPPRVAYAAHAPAIHEEKVTRLTGTSVASVVVSAVASDVWFRWPHLSRVQVMDVLYESGIPVQPPAKISPEIADFYFGDLKNAPEVRRILLCQALKKACDIYGGSCMDNCPLPPKEKPPRIKPPMGKDCKVVDAGEISEPLESMELCGDRTILYNPDEGVPVDPCPSNQFFGISSWPWQPSAYPAPDDDGCSDCGFDPPGGLVLSSQPLGLNLLINIDGDWRGGALSQAILDIGSKSLSLPLGKMGQGDCAIVKNIEDPFVTMENGPNPDGPNPYVLLRFRTEDHRVVTIPLL